MNKPKRAISSNGTLHEYAVADARKTNVAALLRTRTHCQCGARLIRWLADTSPGIPPIHARCPTCDTSKRLSQWPPSLSS